MTTNNAQDIESASEIRWQELLESDSVLVTHLRMRGMDLQDAKRIFQLGFADGGIYTTQLLSKMLKEQK